MRKFSLSFFVVAHSDPDVRRRGQLLLNATLILLGFFCVTIPLLIVVQRQLVAAMIVGVAALPLLLAMALIRRGLVSVAAVLVVALMLLGPTAVILGRGSLAVTPFFYAFAVLVAGLSLRPWQILPVTALALLLLVAVVLLVPPNPVDGALRQNIVAGSVLLMVVTSLYAFLSSRVNSAALREEAAAHSEADKAREAVQMVNAELEAQVTARTAELRRALNDLSERSARQEQLLADLASQRAVIREMSVPVLPVSSATLVMPLIGVLDGERLDNLQREALTNVKRNGARRLIIDITGVPLVDSVVARGLLDTARALRLLGAEVVLVGVRPEVAQTVVGLGVELEGLRAVSTLEAALGAR